jgi:N-formylglutamate deformylase
MNPVEVLPGDSPVILGQPHGGTFVPEEIRAKLNPLGRKLADTDWHIGALYEGLLRGATVVRATFHRYVIDANRPPDGESLYPGQNTTGLVPTTDFDGRPIWTEEPSTAEIARRREAFHAPYHAALAAEVARIHARHGVAVLWDCHSIRSVIPFLFPGTLPVFNIGTNSGATCAPAVAQAATDACTASGLETVVNGRFKGGWTTRHYGRPETGVHAIQMEMAQHAYLAAEAAPWDFAPAHAAPARAALKIALETIERIALSGALIR